MKLLRLIISIFLICIVLTSCEDIASGTSTSTSTYAYVTNLGGNNVSVCSLTTGGALTNCSTSTVTGINGPGGIAFHDYIDGNTTTTYAYVTNNGGNKVSVCSLTTGGALTNCSTPTVTGMNAPVGIAFQSVTN